MRLLYIDHYDSFTFNLIDWLQSCEIKLEIDIIAFDDPLLEKEFDRSPCPIVVSPGPNSPDEVQQTCDLVSRVVGQVPILGICLGHQILGKIAGFDIIKSEYPTHGLTKDIILSGSRFFHSRNLSTLASVAAYNSLVISEGSIVSEWEVTGKCLQGDVQIIENFSVERAPAIGLQFHPESFLTLTSGVISSAWADVLRKSQM